MITGETGKPWISNEVDATVERYFDMFIMDVQGQPFVKAGVYRELSDRFPSRNVNSIERKMSNISAVLVGLGYPHLRGLSPLANYQQSLVESVLAELSRRGSLDMMLDSKLTDRAPVGVVDIVRESPAPTEVITDLLHGRGMARPFKRDYLQLEAANQALGLAGELAVARREQSFLHGIGRTKLADRVEHVAQTKGDGLGYDVLSFDPTGREKWIEVKTTKYAIDVPFFVTRGEVRVSAAAPELYHLYRLYGFGSAKGTGLYRLPGDLEKSCRLDALTFEAAPMQRSSATFI
ncbi:protein NO VEIN domain-containing protein [Arthrobacter sp. MMS24-S77]